MVLFLKVILFARTAKESNSKSRKFIASSNRKAWEDTSFRHNVVEDHEIGRAIALFSAVVLSLASLFLDDAKMVVGSSQLCDSFTYKWEE